MDSKDVIEVDCKDCDFCEVVRPEDDFLAADVYVEHSRLTDHEIDVTPIDEE